MISWGGGCKSSGGIVVSLSLLGTALNQVIHQPKFQARPIGANIERHVLTDRPAIDPNSIDVLHRCSRCRPIFDDFGQFGNDFDRSRANNSAIVWMTSANFGPNSANSEQFRRMSGKSQPLTPAADFLGEAGEFPAHSANCGREFENRLPVSHNSAQIGRF